jgi:hypothetical protein
MHEARATDPRRGRIVLGVVLLLTILVLLMVMREGRKSGGANIAEPDVAAMSNPSVESAAEKARRAAIAALGPIKRRGGINAVDLYKEAMGLYAQLTDAEKKMLERPRDKVDPKVAAALYAKIQPIMDLLRNGRKADYADWGLGPMTFGPAKNAQVEKTLDLNQLARWDAIYRFQSDPDGAVDDLAAMEAMNRSENDSLFGLIVQKNMHLGTMSLLAQNAAGITNAAAADLAYITSPATTEQLFQNGMNANAAILQAELDEYANPATRSQAEPLFNNWSNFKNGKVVVERINPAEGVSEMEWLEQTEQAFATTLTEPEPQFQQWWTQKLAEAASMPTTSIALRKMALTRPQVEASITENAMLAAGMALEQGDQAQFQSILDPATGQPFTYTQTATGFQLGSASLIGPGKPVSLSFSTPAAK